MQSFLKPNKKRQPKHEFNSIYGDRNHRFHGTNNIANQDIIINSVIPNNRLTDYNNSRNKTKNTGRLDLSFTKCNFPNDYLPYVSTNGSSIVGGGGTADNNNAKNHHLIENDRSSSYDDDEEEEGDDDDLHFSNQDLSTVQRKRSHYLVTNHFQTHQSDELPAPPPPLPQLISKQHQQQPHQQLNRRSHPHLPSLSTSSLFTTPLSWYNSLERNRKSLLTPTLAHFYHDTGSRSGTGSTVPLPSLSYHPQSGSSDSSTSSSCLTSSNTNFYGHHLHPHHYQQRGSGRRLARSCGCCLLTLLATLTIITLSIVVGFSLYLAIVTNFLTRTPLLYSIAGNFKVVSGDTFNLRLLNHSSADYLRKSNRYENILHHIVENSLISKSVVKSEIYSFRMEDSLVVFFRLYASKDRLDRQLNIEPKTVINFSRIENIFVDEKVIVGRVRAVLADSFRSSVTFLNQHHGDIVIDSESVKISNIDQLNQQQYTDNNNNNNNNNGNGNGNGGNKTNGKSQRKQQQTDDDDDLTLLHMPHYNGSINNKTNGHKPTVSTTTAETATLLPNQIAVTKSIHPYSNWDNKLTTLNSTLTLTNSSLPPPPVAATANVTNGYKAQNTQEQRFEQTGGNKLNINVNNVNNETLFKLGNSNPNYQQKEKNQTEHHQLIDSSAAINTTNNEDQSLNIETIKQTNGFNTTIDSHIENYPNPIKPNQINVEINTAQPNQSNQTNTAHSSIPYSTLLSNSSQNPVLSLNRHRTNSTIFTTSTANITTETTTPKLPNRELSKFSLPFGIGLRDITTFIVNKVNSQNNQPSKSDPSLNLEFHDSNNTDDEGFALVESRDGENISFENINDDEDDNIAIDSTRLSLNVTSNVSDNKILTTTMVPELKIAQPSTIDIEKPNVDGFIIVGHPEGEVNPVGQNLNETLNEFDITKVENISNKTLVNTSSNRILIASEDSFDLYSVTSSNSNSNSNSNVYTEDYEEDHNKVVNTPTGTETPTTTTTDPTTTATNLVVENEFTLIKYDPNNLPDNEFNNLYSGSLDGGSKFDRRTSKKLNTEPKHQTSNQNNNFKVNSLNHYSNEEKHSSSNNNKFKLTNGSKINNNNIDQNQPESNDIKLVTNKVDQVAIDLATTTESIDTTVITTEPEDETTTATTTMAPACDLGEFQCVHSAECIQLDDICNRIIDCADKSDEFNCRCVDYLVKDGKHRHKICDGIIDCADSSDESSCSQCEQGMFVCNGHQNQCIEMDKVCNGENDCANGDDEQSCIALVNPEDRLPPQDNQHRHGNQSVVPNNQIGAYYNTQGILYIRHHGQWSPLCFDNYNLDINEVHQSNQSSSSLLRIDDMGHAVCKANYYSKLNSIDIVQMDDKSVNQFYTTSSNISNNLKPTLSLWSSLFESSNCPERKVARIECSTLECGLRPVSSKLRRRIIGGKSSSFGSWPWQVALYREGEFQCGAVVINSEWLLTAAHCFYSSPNAYWTARSGVLRRGGLFRGFREEIRRIERIVIHPDYVDKGFINDIALLKLASPLQFSKYIRPICLPGDDDGVSKWHNQLCTTVGWGKLYEHGRIFPDTLQEVKLPILSTEECRKRTLFLPLYKITDNMFCAGFERGGRDACLGDSGGPMMCQKSNGKWILLGITSNGDGCGRAGKPGVYTKVYNYLSWINNITTTIWPINSEPKCLGHRCSLGKCLEPSKVCDNIIDCENSSDELNCTSEDLHNQMIKLKF